MRFPFLPEYLSSGSEDDATDDFLMTYAVSGGSVRFSGADKSPTGPAIPPTAILLNGDIHKPDPLSTITPYEQELAIWRRDNRDTDGGDNGRYTTDQRQTPKALHSPQKLGFDAWCRTGGQDKGTDLTTEVCGDTSLVEVLHSSVTDETGAISASSTSIDQFHACRFDFLIRSLLDVEEGEYETAFSDPLLEGIVLHELAARLYERFTEATDRDGEHIENGTYADHVDAVIRDGMPAARRRFPLPFAILFDEMSERFQLQLQKLVEKDIKSGPWGRTVAVEKTLKRLFDRSGTVLNGRIDRISEYGAGVAIVDYKRSNPPRGTDLIPVSEAASYQMPIYALLLEYTDESVDGAFYYDFKEARFVPILARSDNKAAFDSDSFADFTTEAMNKIDEFASGIRHGNYRTPDAASGCEGCPVRGICRKRFVTE